MSQNYVALAPVQNGMQDQGPKQLQQPGAQQIYAEYLPGFSHLGGEMPFKVPNVRPQNGKTEGEILQELINGEGQAVSCLGTLCGSILCLMTGGLYLCKKQNLIEDGQFGFINNNSKYEMLLPGRHFMLSPLVDFVEEISQGSQQIVVGPHTIIRVMQGSLGFARNGSEQEILLPGLHCRSNPAFKFDSFWSLASPQQVFVFDTIKFFTVNSGEKRLCFDKGRIVTKDTGRYFINSASFQVQSQISVQQQNLRLQKHAVLLDGGVSMLVEGLLTYQVQDVETLIKELGDSEIRRVIEDITKAELSRVFASIHLEQLSTIGRESLAKRGPGAGEGSSSEGARHHICELVKLYIEEYAKSWGVAILGFQLESTRLMDAKYAQEYEEASLALAKAKANQRAVSTENEIKIRKAHNTAAQLQVEAEGKATAVIIDAQAAAKARLIEAESRNQAGVEMSSPFARQYALQGLQVEFAKSLNAQVLTVVPDSIVGKPFAQSMFSGNLAIGN